VTFKVIFHAFQFICFDLQMIYDQSFCYLCVGAGILYRYNFFSTVERWMCPAVIHVILTMSCWETKNKHRRPHWKKSIAKM